MKVLVLGGGGMLGQQLVPTLHSTEHEVFATFRGETTALRALPPYRELAADRLISDVDAMDFRKVRTAIERTKPQVVVNCIGVIKQVAAAADPIITLTLNSLLPHRLAELCARNGIRLVHLSTDCVYSGNQGDYVESAPPDPADLYGRSKLLGEVSGPGCLTLRTSIIGRDLFKSIGLLEWFLSQRGNVVTGFTHATFSGFTTRVMSRLIEDVLSHQPDLDGLYHLGSEPITKFDLLRRLNEALDLGVTLEPRDTPRCDRSLNSARFLAATGIKLPSWEAMIDDLVPASAPG